ncbi:MAG: class IV adenylate cyclase [Wenzhouxiangellaceae bacterium]
MQINNIEIKVRIADADKARRAIETLADGPAEVLEQKDTYFNAGNEAYLKLREELAQAGHRHASLVAYRRDRRAEPRPSDIRLVRIDRPDELHEALAHALGTLVVVDKIRRLYFRGQTRIHLDEVDRLGAFLELEVVLEPGQTEADGLRIANDLLDDLNLVGSQAQTESYRDLLLKAENALDQ